MTDWYYFDTNIFCEASGDKFKHFEKANKVIDLAKGQKEITSEIVYHELLVLRNRYEAIKFNLLKQINGNSTAVITQAQVLAEVTVVLSKEKKSISKNQELFFKKIVPSPLKIIDFFEEYSRVLLKLIRWSAFVLVRCIKRATFLSEANRIIPKIYKKMSFHSGTDNDVLIAVDCFLHVDRNMTSSNPISGALITMDGPFIYEKSTSIFSVLKTENPCVNLSILSLERMKLS